MREMLKAMSLAALFVFIASTVLTGCATQTPAPTQPAAQTQAPTEAPTPVPTATPLPEVHLYGYLLGAALPGMPDVMNALNEKLKKDVNATMEINYIGWSDLQAKYPLILAAGENVDWIYTAAWCQYPTQAAKGAFMEMTPELYEKYMPLHWAKIKDTPALKQCSIDGKDYMIPTATPDKKVPVVLYREDLRKKYNVPEIKKFSDIEPYLAAIKANEPGIVPMQLDNTYDLGTPHGALVTESSSVYIDILMVTGSGCGLDYDPFATDGNLYLPSSDPTLLPVFSAAAKKVKSWYDAGYINHDAFANKVRSKEVLPQGKTAVAFGNSVDVQGTLAQCAANGLEIGIIPTVSGKTGTNTANAFTNNGIAISAKSKNWERALMAMDLVMEDPAYDNLAYYGVEGKHYMLKDGKIDVPDTLDKNAYPLDQAGFWFVNKDLFKPLTSWTQDYIDLQAKIPSLLQTDLLAAFSVNTDKIKTEAANCNQVLVQYNNPIVLGAVPDVDAAFKTLDEKLKAAGVDAIKTELTAQIQAYLASMK